jgi:hypothetical protein
MSREGQGAINGEAEESGDVIGYHCGACSALKARQGMKAGADADADAGEVDVDVGVNVEVGVDMDVGVDGECIWRGVMSR